MLPVTKTSVLKRFLRERNISLHLFDYIDTYFSRRYRGVLVNKCDLMLCFLALFYMARNL